MRKHLRRPVLVLAMSAILIGVMVAPVGAAPTAKNTHVSGEGVAGFSGTAKCPYTGPGAGADYHIDLTGDLVGCVYGFVTSFTELPNGIYQEIADEIFVGTFDGKTGTWEMTEHFTSKFDPDTGDQIFGRCQHPITTDSGGGDFAAGVSGRLDFKDDVSTGIAHYRGHIKVTP